jgi:hypothetical protein
MKSAQCFYLKFKLLANRSVILILILTLASFEKIQSQDDGPATPTSESAETLERMDYDAAAITGVALEQFNSQLGADIGAFSRAPQCYQTYDTLPEGYPDFCSMGALETSNAQRVADAPAVRARRTNNLRNLCQNETAQGNREALGAARLTQEGLIERDRNVAQQAENDFVLDISTDPDFYTAIFNVQGFVDVDIGTLDVGYLNGCDMEVSHKVHGPDHSMPGMSHGLDTTSCRMGLARISPIVPDCTRWQTAPTEDDLECRGLGDFTPVYVVGPCFGNEERTACEGRSRAMYEREMAIFLERRRTRCAAHFTRRLRSCEADRVRIQAEIEASSAAEQASQEACVEELRRARDEQIRRRREAAEAELEASRQEVYRSCRARAASANKQVLCTGGRGFQFQPECAGVTNNYRVEDERSYGAGHPDHPMSREDVISAEVVRREVDRLRDTYNLVFEPEQRQTLCAERLRSASICQRLEQNYQDNQNRYQSIYSEDRMSRYRQVGQNLIDRYRGTLEELLPGEANAAKRQLLLDRLNKIKFQPAMNSYDLMDSENLFAFCSCHPEAMAAGGHTHGGANPSEQFRECESSTIMLSPALMLAMDGPGGEERLSTILMHEIGHALAPDLTGSEQVFGQLAQCLGPAINLDSFPENHRRTAQKESVADWLASRVMGDMIESDAENPESRNLALANRLDFFMCSVITPELNGEAESCSVRADGSPRYFDELTRSGSSYSFSIEDMPYYCSPNSFQHPRAQDRLAIFARSPAIRQSLGCPTSAHGSRTQDCEL